MITIPTIIPPRISLYSREHGFLRIVNEYEFYDVRVQIKKEFEGKPFVQFTDYYANDPISGETGINSDGRLENYPESFNLIENYLMELF